MTEPRGPQWDTPSERTTFDETDPEVGGAIDAFYAEQQAKSKRIAHPSTEDVQDTEKQ